MRLLRRLRSAFTPAPRPHNDSLRAGVFEDVTPLAVLVR